MKLLVYLVDLATWSEGPVSSLTEQITDSAQRIRQKMATKRERRRFTLACARLEALAAEQAMRTFLVKGARAEALLSRMPRIGQAALPFLEVGQAIALDDVLPPPAIDHLAAGGGLVVVLEPFDRESSIVETGALETIVAQREEDRDAEHETSSGIQTVRERARAQLLRAWERKSVFGWSGDSRDLGRRQSGLPRHEILTEILREFADQSADRPPSWVPIAFKDGTQSAPFPLFALESGDLPFGPATSIRAALVSCRHLALDREVDFSLLRNLEITGDRDTTIAEQEMLAFERCREILGELCRRVQRLDLELYHTGLEPAVIGAYRATVDLLTVGGLRGRLKVTPMILKRDGSYKPLRAWC